MKRDKLITHEYYWVRCGSDDWYIAEYLPPNASGWTNYDTKSKGDFFIFTFKDFDDEITEWIHIPKPSIEDAHNADKHSFSAGSSEELFREVDLKVSPQ